MYGYIKEGLASPNEVKIIFGNNKITARRLTTDIERLSGFLHAQGLRKGDTVAVALPNIPQAAVALYAANRIGLRVNLIHPTLKGEALRDALQSTATKLVFMYDFILPRQKKLLDELGILAVACSYAYYLKGIKQFYRIIEPLFSKYGAVPYARAVKYTSVPEDGADGSETAVYLHSSGTAGRSKTLMLSAHAFNMLSDNILSMIENDLGFTVSADDCMLNALPIFHGFGLGVCVHLPLRRFKMALAPFFKTSEIALAVRKNRISIGAAVPGMINKLVDYKKFHTRNLQNFRLFFSGGDKLSAALKNKMDALLEKYGSECKIMEGYGLSEVASVATINIRPEKNHSQGLPLPNVEIIITGEGGRLNEGEGGEICIYSPSAMNGYLHGEAEYTVFDRKKFLHTGDYGYIKDGFLYFKDRIKRIIIIGGINVYPQEVEDAISGIENIKGVCVARVFASKPYTKAYIALEKGRLTAPLKSRIIKEVENKVMRYAVPLEFEQVDTIKRNAIGKADFTAYEKEIISEYEKK